MIIAMIVFTFSSFQQILNALKNVLLLFLLQIQGKCLQVGIQARIVVVLRMKIVICKRDPDGSNFRDVGSQDKFYRNIKCRRDKFTSLYNVFIIFFIIPLNIKLARLQYNL